MIDGFLSPLEGYGMAQVCNDGRDAVTAITDIHSGVDISVDYGKGTGDEYVETVTDEYRRGYRQPATYVKIERFSSPTGAITGSERSERAMTK